MADKLRIKNNFDKQGRYQPSDSEDDLSDKDKKLLENIRKRKYGDSESEEELFRFSESDEDEDKDEYDMADSDVEGQEKSDDDLPDSKAWGKKKQAYYSTDYVDEDYGGFGNDEEAALQEEQEAKNIQKKLLEQLGDEDFSLDFFKKDKSEIEGEETVIKSDLSQLSKRQKLQLLEKESPEFLGLIGDFKSKLTVAKDDLKPVLNLVQDGKLPACAASKFVETNYELILNYCTNISFYLLLKAKKTNIQNHPVTKRLYQYRQMLNQMEPIYIEVIKPQIDKILDAIKSNTELVVTQDINKQGNKRKSSATSDSSSKKLKLLSTIQKEKQDGNDTGVSDDSDEDQEGIEIEPTAKGSKNESDSESGFSDNEDEEKDEPEKVQNFISKPSTSGELNKDMLVLEESGDKRQITYQMAKNKGLTPHRKKEQRNPRVKHKMKYRKAKIRRKGAIRDVRTELTRYGGESSGIKANVKKSIKIK